MMLCFIGVVLIALYRPSSLQQSKVNVESFGIILMILVAWTQAVINITNRRLRDVHFAIIGFFHPILGFMVTAGYMAVRKLSTGEGMGTHSGWVYFEVFVACCFDFL